MTARSTVSSTHAFESPDISYKSSRHSALVHAERKLSINMLTPLARNEPEKCVHAACLVAVPLLHLRIQIRQPPRRQLRPPT